MQPLHLYFLPVIYLAVSLPIFYKVYETSNMIIDEEFHIRQARAYCLNKFGVWDPKITTLPGLYLLSYLLLPLHYCTTFYLRSISLIASVVNVVFILRIRNRGTETNVWNLLLDTLNISMLPPMYFFSHLYYTDIVSITTVLALYYYWSEKKHVKGAVAGVASILVRQTNVIWIIMVLGITGLDQLAAVYGREVKKKPRDVNFLSPITIVDIIRKPRMLIDSLLNIPDCHVYVGVIVAFIGFVVYNGSIVVGDKSAHQAVLHVPQLFYFTAFILCFGLPALHECVPTAFRLMKDNINVVTFISTVVAVAVAYNTMVHPYLLADNRHYTFYIWNRFYGKYKWFKFAMIPVYIFGLFFTQTIIRNKSRNFQIMFWICSVMVLVPQKLLEIRYFLIPYLLLRLNCSKVNRKSLILEFIWNALINIIVFYLFFTKNIHWTNFEKPQKLIW